MVTTCRPVSLVRVYHTVLYCHMITTVMTSIEYINVNVVGLSSRSLVGITIKTWRDLNDILEVNFTVNFTLQRSNWGRSNWMFNQHDIEMKFVLFELGLFKLKIFWPRSGWNLFFETGLSTVSS